MTKKTSAPPVLWILLSALLMGVLASAVMLGRSQPVQMKIATVLPEGRSIPPFTLQTQQGTWGNAQLQNRWTLVFVGFTHCPDICPSTLALLKGVYQKLEQQNPEKAQKLQVLFLSVDPERDQPEVLSRYVQYFHPKFLGATAPVPALEKIAAAWGFVFQKVVADAAKPDDYTLDHSSSFVLFSPDGKIKAYFVPAPSFKIEDLVSDLESLL